MHRDAEACEADRLASQRDSGIVQACSSRVTRNWKALIGTLKMMCWLAKEEVPHTTKFSSLWFSLVRELNLGKNAHYMSEQSVRELIQCLSTITDS